MVNSERNSLDHTIEGFLDTLPSDIKDSLLSKIWADHVYEDIRGMDMSVSKERAKSIQDYVDGRYDTTFLTGTISIIFLRKFGGAGKAGMHKPS